MRKVFRFSNIQVAPFPFSCLEVVIGGHLGIELDICGGVFIQITTEVLDLGKMTLTWGGALLR